LVEEGSRGRVRCRSCHSGCSTFTRWRCRAATASEIAHRPARGEPLTGAPFGTVTQDANDGSFGILVIRRRVDHVWTVTAQDHGFASKADALARMELHLREGG